MKPESKAPPINQTGTSSTELGTQLAVRVMLAGIISYQAATSANENISAPAIVAEMKRIIGTVIEAMDLQVKSVSDGSDPIVIEEEIRQAALEYLDQTFSFVKV